MSSKRALASRKGSMTFRSAQCACADHIFKSDGAFFAVIRLICIVSGMDWSPKCTILKLHTRTALKVLASIPLIFAAFIEFFYFVMINRGSRCGFLNIGLASAY